MFSLVEKYEIRHFKVVRSTLLAELSKSHTQSGKEITIYMDEKSTATNWLAFAAALEIKLRARKVLSGGVPQGRFRSYQDAAALQEHLIPGSYYLSFRTDKADIVCPLKGVDFTELDGLAVIPENEGKREGLSLT